jgi:hypothetical protein
MKLGKWLSGLLRGVVVRGGVMQDPATTKWRAVFMASHGKELCSADEFATRVEAEAYLDEAIEAHGLQAHRLQ